MVCDEAWSILLVGFWIAGRILYGPDSDYQVVGGILTPLCAVDPLLGPSTLQKSTQKGVKQGHFSKSVNNPA